MDHLSHVTPKLKLKLNSAKKRMLIIRKTWWLAVILAKPAKKNLYSPDLYILIWIVCLLDSKLIQRVSICLIWLDAFGVLIPHNSDSIAYICYELWTEIKQYSKWKNEFANNDDIIVNKKVIYAGDQRVQVLARNKFTGLQLAKLIQEVDKIVTEYEKTFSGVVITNNE